MSKKRQYDSSYIKYGFTEIEINREIRSQCVICTVVLSNDALKQAKLQRHLHKVHPTLKDRPPEFFERKCKSLKKMKLGPSGASVASSQQVLIASIEISQLSY
ncbi:protein FAM200B-like [Daktulosphaira vitifoliae]|uniref:protein FAM200B-like n=1 Tax=Daktulosphaira vitifoliae TaxID=58002 RepID=UPI0021AB08BA|nr:protein FAM200B-like [Daktulosphaira vitifoliae]